MMKNITKHITILSLAFLLLPNWLTAQSLRNHMLYAQINGGITQKKANFGYQYKIAHFNREEGTHKGQQLFLGLEAGKIHFNNRYDIRHAFYINGKGNHVGLSMTIVTYKNHHKTKYAANHFTIKIGTSKFTNLKTGYNFDDYNGDDDLDGGRHEGYLSDVKFRSTDIEMDFGQHIRLDSRNFIKCSFYTGMRIGVLTGTKHFLPNGFSKEYSDTFYHTVNPFIFGFRLSYQFNIGNYNRR